MLMMPLLLMMMLMMMMMMTMTALSSQRRRLFLYPWDCLIAPRSAWLGISCVCSSLALVLGDVSCDARARPSYYLGT
jgi:hypothetical protein